VASRGFAAAFTNLGLASIVGRDLNSVIAVIQDAICPEGAIREQVAAREAGANALEIVFAEVIDAGAGLEQLNSLTADDVVMAIGTMVASYIYNRWLGDLGVKIEEKAISPQQAVGMERRMKGFIRDAVKIDLAQRDPLRIDWRGREGREVIERIYSDAFAVIGGER
jgi:hypothetical protein